MAYVRSLCIFVTVASMMACAASQVGYDYDTSAPLRSYRTYEWLGGEQETTGDKRVDNTLVNARIRTAVEQQLRAKGYRNPTSGTPDFYVAYHVGLKDLMKGASTQHYIGDRAHGTYTTTSDIQPYKEGALLVDILDGATKQLVWRGSAQAEVAAGATPRQRDERINEVVKEMFSHFPPK